MNEQEVLRLIETDQKLAAHLSGKCRVAIVGDYLVHQSPDGQYHLLQVGYLYGQSDGEWDCGFGKLVQLINDDMLSRTIERHRPFIEWYVQNDGHNPTFTQEESALREALAGMLEQAAATGNLTVIRVRIQRRRRFFNRPEGRSGNPSEDNE